MLTIKSILLMCFILTSSHSYAAFTIPAQHTQPVYNVTNTDEPPTKSTASKGKIWAPVVALSCGVVGLLIGGLLLGICGIVFGAIGMSKKFKLKGLSIAGLVLGIIDFIAVLAILGAAKK